MRLKILSWNIWFDGHFDQISEFINAFNADVLGLQEVILDDKNRDVISFLKSLGYAYVFSPAFKVREDGRTVGNAIFSKYQILNSEVLNYPNDDRTRNAIRADIKIGDDVLHFFTTHLVHTHQQPSEVQAQQARDLIAVLPKEHVIVTGDFNATPESEAVKIISQTLINSDSTHAATWSVYPDGCPVCKPQKIDTRLDYIFTSKDIKISSSKVENSKGSDHLPISVTIEI